MTRFSSSVSGARTGEPDVWNVVMLHLVPLLGGGVKPYLWGPPHKSTPMYNLNHESEGHTTSVSGSRGRHRHSLRPSPAGRPTHSATNRRAASHRAGTP